MRADEQAEILRRLEECRVALAATVTSLERAEEGVKLWATQPPNHQDIDELFGALRKEAQAVRSFDQMVNDCERLARPRTEIIRDEGVEDVSEPTSQGGPIDVLRGTETSVSGIHSALRDVATILGALEYGERVDSHEYREKRNLVIDLAAQCDGALQQLSVLRERMDGTAMPREGKYRRRRDDR